MKKWYLITAAVLLLVGYIILPSGTPAEEVKSWLASECTVIAVFYFLFSSYKWDETVN